MAASLAWQPNGTAATDGLSIAVLNVERVMRQSTAGKALRDQIDKIRSANQAKDKATEEALRAEDQKLRKQRAVLSDEAFRKKQQELQDRLDGLRKEFEARRKRIQAGVDKAWNLIRQAMLQVTEELASERKLDIVFSQRGTVLMAKDLNITKDVLARLNDKLTEVPLEIESN